LFSTIYNDDLTAKTLPSLVGFGIKRSKIIISKMIISVIMSVLIFFAAFIVYYLIFTILGFNMDGNMRVGILNIAVVSLLKLLAYSTIASVVVYGIQKATFSIVAFILLVTGLISQILFLILTHIKDIIDLYQFTLIPIVGGFIQEATFLTLLPYIIYVAIFFALSIIAFHKKDLEF